MALMGTVKRYFEGRRCGFIRGENGKDYFVRYYQIKSDGPLQILEEGEKVQFVPAPSKKPGRLLRRALRVQHRSVISPKRQCPKVVDLTQFEAGPTCAEAPASMGAQVVKVENQWRLCA